MVRQFRILRALGAGRGARMLQLEIRCLTIADRSSPMGCPRLAEGIRSMPDGEGALLYVQSRYKTREKKSSHESQRPFGVRNTCAH
jgi:hypothetical protein